MVKDLSDATGRSWSVSDVLGAETLGDITLKASSRTALFPVGKYEPKTEDKIRVKDLEEPHLLRRLWFTLLARIVGAQIAVCGAMPAFVLESYVPTRWRLARRCGCSRRASVLGSHYGSRRNCPDLLDRILAFLIMRFCEINGWSSLLQDYASGRRRTVYCAVYDGAVRHRRGLLSTWCLGCHLACAVGKWLIVGRQRAGRFRSGSLQ